jgi:lipoprotein-anchoring transpeptidase ErfK/SrfK
VRLTNWDAEDLAQMVQTGTTVIFLEGEDRLQRQSLQ